MARYGNRKSVLFSRRARVLERTTFAAFLMGWFIVCPVRDYFTNSYFLGIVTVLLLPQAVILLAALLFAAWSLRRAFLCLRARNTSAALNYVAWPTGGVIVAITAILIVHDRARWGGTITRSNAYGTLSISLALLLIAAPVILTLYAAPLWAIGRSIFFLVNKRVNAALVYAAIPIMGVLCYFAGQSAADFIAVRTVGPVIQSAIRDVRNGQPLPPASQSYSVSVLARAPAVATYSLGGPLFLASYIAYDEANSTTQTASGRIAKLLDGGHCEVSVRPIGAHYYFVNEAC